MPEDAQKTIQVLLSTLEDLKNTKDDAKYTCKSHFELLNTLTSTLASCQEITSTDAERVLTVSLQYKTDIKCAPYVLSNISSLIKMNKARTMELDVEFLQSALAVLYILALLKKNFGDKEHHLQAISFQVFMSHPHAALIKLVKHYCSILIEILKLFLSLKPECTRVVKIEDLSILQLLSILPSHERSIFVKEGIPLWLSSVLPAIIKALVTVEDTEKIQNYVTYLELLASELVAHDYFEYSEWEMFLENVVDSEKFPMSMKTLLLQSKAIWHRVWIVIIKLLKSNVTRYHGSCCVINALLPVVETAFMQNRRQRVRAFECWNQLIRNFASEINIDCIERVQLVVIPIRLNNTKTEVTAMAKFNTWWLFVRKYKSRLETFTELILIEFIHFLFGKGQSSKSSFWVGRVSENVRKICLEAFVEVVGHSECEESTRCTSIVPLGGAVINTVMLDGYWADWLYAIKCAVRVVAVNYNPETQKNIRCIWKSFMLLLTEVADGSARKFNDLIKMLSVLAQNSVIYEDFMVMVFEDLILPLCKDDRMQKLLNSNPDHHPMHKLVTLITGKTFDSYYNKFLPQDLSNILQPIVSNLLRESVTNPEYTILLLDDLPTTDSSLKLWTEFIRTTYGSDLSLELLSALLRWPFKVVQNSTHVKDAALAWYTLLNAVHVKLDKIGFLEDVSKLLTKSVDESKAVNYFILFALITVLKIKPDEEKMAKLEALTNQMNNYECFEPLMPPLVETLTFVIDNIISVKPYENLAQITINCVNNLLILLNSRASTNDRNKSLISSEATSIDEQANIIVYINEMVLSDTIILSLRKLLENILIKKEIVNINSSFDEGIIEELSIQENHIQYTKNKSHVVPKEFDSPKVKEENKNPKTVSSIVNTVDENGKEYVVVNSNWPTVHTSVTNTKKYDKITDSNLPLQSDQRPADDIPATTKRKDVKITHSTLPLPSDEKTAVQTPATKTKIYDKITDSSSLQSEERHARMKSKSQKNDDIVLLPLKRTLKSNKPQINSQKSIVPELIVPQVHTIGSAKHNTGIYLDGITANEKNEASNKENENQAPTITKEVVRVLSDVLIKPATPIKDKITEKIPEKPTTIVEVPRYKNKASHGIENTETKLLNETQELSNMTGIDFVPKKIKNITESAKKYIPRMCVETSPASNDKLLKVDKVVRTPKGTKSPIIFTASKTLVSKSLNADKGKDIAVTAKKESQNIKLVRIPAKKTKKSDNITNSALSLQTGEKPGFCDPPTRTKKSDKIANVTLALQSVERPVVHTPAKAIDNQLIDKDSETLVTKSINTYNKVIAVTEKEGSQNIQLVHTPSKKKKRDGKITDSTLPLQSDQRPAGDIPVTTKRKYVKITHSTLPLPSDEKTAVQTPATKTKIYDKITDSSSLQSEERHARMKRKSKKNDDIVLLPLKKTRKSNEPQTNSQKSIIPELIVPQVHTIESAKHSTGIYLAGITANEKNEASNKGNENQAPTITKEFVIVLNDVLITPRTPNKDKITEKLPKKPTTIVEVPRHKDKASHGIKNTETKLLNESQDLNKKKTVAPKPSVKKTSRKSRVEIKLMIDVEEGQSKKRITSKKKMDDVNNSRRKSSAGKQKKSKLEATPRSTKNLQEKKIVSNRKKFTVKESQDKQSRLPVDSIMDEPSVQDSTITTVNVKPTKLTLRKPIVSLERLKINEIQDLINRST